MNETPDTGIYMMVAYALTATIILGYAVSLFVRGRRDR